MNLLKEDTPKKRRARTCPECRSTHLVERLDEECAVCVDCGFVISAETAKRSSKGKTNADLRKYVRSTSCSDQLKSFVKKKEPIRENMALVLEKWGNVRISDSTEKNLALALQHITEIAVDLSLPKIVLEKAAIIYEKITINGFVRGRSIKAICAAVVYIACKECGLARTDDEIAIASKVSTREVNRNFRLLVKKLGLSIPPMKPTDYVLQISARLSLHAETAKIAKTISKVAENMRLLTGKDPVGIAAAATYIGSLIVGERKTQREIAEITHVTETTIRNRSRDLQDFLFFLETL